MMTINGERSALKLSERKGNPLPDDIFIALVSGLFQANGSLIASVLVSTLVSLVVSMDSGTIASLSIAGAIFATGVGRLVINSRFQKTDIAAMSPHAARRWERDFAIFAWGQSLAFGVLVFFTFTTVNRTVDNLLVDATACGIAAGITARNANRPRIAMGQLANLLLPIFLACLYRDDYRYLILGALNVLFFLSSSEVINNLNKKTINLLMLSREKTNLASSLTSKNVILDTTFENMSHGICVFDADQTVIIANTRYQHLLDLPDSMRRPGTRLREIVQSILILDGQGDRINKVMVVLTMHLAKNVATSAVWKFKNGRRLALSLSPMANGGAVVLFDDVTERDRMTARIAHMASHDHLTDLPNRATLNDRVEKNLRTLRDGATLVLFCLDLDRFKAVNDTLGHAAGDTVLREVARRIRAEMTGSMMAARVGGDEFVVAAVINDKARMLALARRLIASLSAPYTIDTSQGSIGVSSIGVSIGIAVVNDRTMNAQELYRRADVALYEVKRNGRGDLSIYSEINDRNLCLA